MNSKYVVLFLLFSGACLFSAAQMKFVEGYIVTNDHQKTVCQIRNGGNAESSMNFEYRLIRDQKIEKIELAKIEEFGIANELKCVRAMIKIDVSPNRITHLKDTVNSPEWEEGHAYLRVLVDGKSASLYSYFNEGTNDYFFSVGNSAIEPLFYKEYRVEITPGIVEQKLLNNAYQQQLKQYLTCGKTEEVSKVSYTKKDLVNYFITYQLCKDADYIVPKNTHLQKGSLRFKLGTSLNMIQMDTQTMTDAAEKVVFSQENSLGFGAEAEYLFSFNNYKWGLFAESNYYAYHSEKVSIESYNGSVVDYKTIELPVGITYYMNILADHRLFIRGAFVPHYILGSSFVSYDSAAQYDYSPSSRMFFGAGYNYRRFGAEFRYYSTQNVTQNLYKRGSQLTQVSFRLSYTLFQTGK